MEEEHWLTVEDVADRLQVRPETVRSWLREGRMIGLNLGGRSGWRVSEHHFRTFVEQAQRGQTRKRRKQQ